MLLLVHAHPYPDRSRANRALLDSVSGLSGVQVRSLYDRYPDFAIDVAAEQAALAACDALVLQCPLHWYSVPALLKLWFEKVLTDGWAFGRGGEALRGKRCLWAVTTGGDEHAYSDGGIHERPFTDFVPVVEQTVRLCHMQFETPFVVHGAQRLPEHELAKYGEAYRDRLFALRSEVERA